MSWLLSGLEEYTIYIIHVLFYTVGISPYSLPLEIQTAEDGTCDVVSGMLGKVRRGLGSLKVGSRGSWMLRWRGRRGSKDKG